jgi:two-component system LytT family response regulator
MDKRINTIVIDDRKSNVELLAHYLEGYCTAYIETVYRAYSISEAIEKINTFRPEVVFLDVQMDNETTGFDILDKITPYPVKVVFVTSFEGYAIKAIKYNAIDYLLKPIDFTDCAKIVKRVHREFNEITEQKDTQNFDKSLADFRARLLPVMSLKTIDFIEKSEIIYCKSQGFYTIFKLKNATDIVSSKNIGEYEKILGANFLRVHKSFIINVNLIARIHKVSGVACEMIEGSMISVAVRKVNLLYSLLGIKTKCS